jgi:hypothetical protein
VIYVVGSQPILIDNIIRNNASTDTAAISIDANSLKATSVVDWGNQVGVAEFADYGLGNMGPLVQKNRLGDNAINGMRVRGATLTTESIWDDTDIVHVLQSSVIVPDFHTYGGLRLQSKVNESLVVKLQGSSAGFEATGRPLDIPTRIGGSLQVIGSPGFPVVLTSLLDDSIGAGFDPSGRPQSDTDGAGTTVGRPGDWRSIRISPYSNDRNVDTTFELEADKIQDRAVNDIPDNAQELGQLANTLRGGDENLRLGFSVHGTIAAPSDLDVYQFTATAGTMVWIDIDRTSGGLDSVVELIDQNGQILALSDNSLDDSILGTALYDSGVLGTKRVLPMDTSIFAYRWNAIGASWRRWFDQPLLHSSPQQQPAARRDNFGSTLGCSRSAKRYHDRFLPHATASAADGRSRRFDRSLCGCPFCDQRYRTPWTTAPFSAPG